MAHAVKIPVEKSDAIYQSLSYSQAEAAAGIVQLNGYRCNSISKFKPLILDRGYHLICNNWQYSYTIKDKGGKMIVEVE